jgi:hypothetical protein
MSTIEMEVIMKKLHTFIRNSLSGLVVAAVITGCASVPDSQSANGKLTVERVDSRDARIAHVYVQPDGSELRITGDIRKTFQRRGRIPGHLHIEVIGENGMLLAQTTSRYHRRSVKSRQSHFSETIPVQQGKVTKVRVIHHGLHESHS